MRSLRPLFFVCVIDVLGFGIMVPLLPYLAERFGASPATITQLFAIYSLCQLIASPIWGRLSDRFGRRPILLISMAGACTSYLMIGFAHDLVWLFIARALAGAMAGNLSAAFAYAADVSSGEDRARAMGMVGAAIAIGFSLGPAIGGLLAGDDARHADFRLPALVAAALSLLAMGLVVALLQETRPAQAHDAAQRQRIRAWRLLRERPGLRWMVLSALLVTYAQSTLESIFAIWAMDRYHAGPRSIGLALFAMAMIVVLMQGVLMRRLVPIFGEKRLALLGIGCFAAGMLVTATGGTLATTAMGLALMGVGAGAYNPAGSALASRQALEADRGAVMGTYQAGASLARVIGPFASGPIYSGIGHNAPFLVAGLVVLQALWCVLSVSHSSTSGELR